MEQPSGRRLRRSPPPDGSDLTSALPDEMLRLIIARISCVRTMVQTGLLSRRWRGLWTGLALIMHDFTPATVTEALLARSAVAPPVSALQIRLVDPTAQETNSLLRAAALSSPPVLVFILTHNLANYMIQYLDIELPCFNRAISIDLDAESFRIMPPPTGQFTALESLSLKGRIVDLGGMLHRCPRLRTVSLAFRGVAPDSVKATLTSLEAAAPRASVCLLDIHIHNSDCISAPQFASLLRTAARVSPRQLVLTRDWYVAPYCETINDAELPCFNRATSIKMSLRNICFTQLPTTEFSALEELFLSRCKIIDLPILLSLCTRLRVLTVHWMCSNITVHSTTLQELNVYSTECRSIDIMTPVLRQLMLDVQTYTDYSVSISVPLVEKVMSKRSYMGLASLFGFWSLGHMGLKTVVHQLSRVHVLYLHISVNDSVRADLDLALELDKILVTEFSTLELHLEAADHVSGALVSRLLGIHHIQTSTQSFKVILEHRHKAIRECRNCPCDEPKNWRSQSISLPRLEEVEIEGFNGDRRQLDLLKLVLRCAPMLKTVTIKLISGLHRENFRGGWRKIYNSFLEYPSMSHSVYLYDGGLFRHSCG